MDGEHYLCIGLAEKAAQKIPRYVLIVQVLAGDRQRIETVFVKFSMFGLELLNAYFFNFILIVVVGDDSLRAQSDGFISGLYISFYRIVMVLYLHFVF